MGATKAIGGLTPKEKVFVQEFAKSGNASKAAQIAYPNQKKENITKYVACRLKKPRIRKAIKQILEDTGITDKYIADKLKQHIDDGMGVKPTAQTSMKALEVAVKLREFVGKDRQPSMHFHFLQELNLKDRPKLLQKRQEQQQFFTQIEEGEEVIGHSSTTPKAKQAKQ